MSVMRGFYARMEYALSPRFFRYTDYRITGRGVDGRLPVTIKT